MHKKQEADAGRRIAAITPGQLQFKETAKYALHSFDAAKAFTKLWNISPTMQVPMKTFGPDQGEIHYNDGSGSIGRLNDVTVTLMRLTNPNTALVSLQMSLEYFATSDGSRTPDGRALPGATHDYNPGHEDYRINHYVYFRNSSGGLVYTWWVGTTFELLCGWNRKHCIHGKVETNVLDWFDAVDRYQWEVGGAFYRC
jgi:hypothetical protein